MRHFSPPPAMPMARQPLILAIWPASEPTAPAAAETTTVCPSCGCPISSRPKYAVAGHHRVALDPEQPAHVIALGHPLVTRGDHPADAERSHHLADSDRRHVGLALVEPRAHGGVQRDVQHLDLDLALGRIGDGLLDELPRLSRRETAGPARETELPVSVGHGYRSPRPGWGVTLPEITRRRQGDNYAVHESVRRPILSLPRAALVSRSNRTLRLNLTRPYRRSQTGRF